MEGYFEMVYDHLDYNATGTDYFDYGHRVSINSDGSYIAVSGITTNNDASNNANTDYYQSRVVIYKDENGQWVEKGLILGEKVNFLKDAQTDISLSGNGKRIAIGALKNQRTEINQDASGSVKVYEQPLNSNSGPYSYLEQFYDGTGGQGGEWVGITVSMSADGEELAYGVLYHDSTGFQNEGQVKYCVVSSEQCSIISEIAAQDDLVGTVAMETS